MEDFELAINQANHRAIFENQKEKLKEILQGQLICSINGGQFKLDITLFLEIRLYIDEGRNQQVLLDMNMNPIRIDNLQQFYDDTRSQYSQAINKYTAETAKLKRSRHIETMVQLDLEDDIEE